MSLSNPYRNGAYHFTVAALLALGLNKPHKFTVFAARLEKVWQKADAEGWKDFKNRKARNKETAKGLDGRIFQNCRVLQRVKDYGRPLLRAGAVLDMTRNDGGVLHVSLNTHSKKPQKPGRAPKPSKPATKPPKPKAKSTRKPSGGKKGAGKRSVKATEAVPTTSDAVKTATDEPTKAV